VSAPAAATTKEKNISSMRFITLQRIFPNEMMMEQHQHQQAETLLSGGTGGIGRSGGSGGVGGRMYESTSDSNLQNQTPGSTESGNATGSPIMSATPFASPISAAWFGNNKIQYQQEHQTRVMMTMIGSSNFVLFERIHKRKYQYTLWEPMNEAYLS
jgi:hypothetical protein